MKISYKLSRCAGLLLVAAPLIARADDQIRVYTVPKEHPPAQASQALPAAGAPDIPINSAPIHWTLPAGWQEKPADGIRRASFAVNGENGGKAEVAITSFPGLVGTDLSNVNRWRNELGLAPVEESDLTSESVTVDSSPGKLYDMSGASARTVVANVLHNGSSWFIKLRGDAATVAAAKPIFLEFLKSLQFGGDGVASDPAIISATSGEPHAGLAAQGSFDPQASAASAEPASDTPKWNVPSQWVETAPASAMTLKRFSISGNGGGKAEMTISFFQGAVGGVLANVNRWRGQLGQPPIEESQLTAATESMGLADGTATLTDFAGTNARTGQPARMVGAIVPHGDKTWFYKLMGDDKVVEGQKNSFVEFVKNVQYP